jgi:hypothetical protein
MRALSIHLLFHNGQNRNDIHPAPDTPSVQNFLGDTSTLIILTSGYLPITFGLSLSRAFRFPTTLLPPTRNLKLHQIFSRVALANSSQCDAGKAQLGQHAGIKPLGR